MEFICGQNLLKQLEIVLLHSNGFNLYDLLLTRVILGGGSKLLILNITEQGMFNSHF
jgi:hypothetical protein